MPLGQQPAARVDRDATVERGLTLQARASAIALLDETKVLDAKLAEYVLVARRNGRDWYIGAMSNWTGRDLEVDLSFLPSGTFTMDSYHDGVNADRMAGDYVKTRTQVTSSKKLRITLAPGGGWAARIHP